MKSNLFTQSFIMTDYAINENDNIITKRFFSSWKEGYTTLQKDENIYNQYDIDCFLNGSSYSRLINKYIKPILKIKPIHLPDNTLVIHIRFGDCAYEWTDSLLEKDPNNSYGFLPFWYYDNIITENKYKNILIVTEKGRESPLISQIKNKYPHTQVQTEDIHTDMSTIITAKNLVLSLSTFSIMLSLLMEKNSTVFVPLINKHRKWSQIYDNCSHLNVKYTQSIK